MDSEDRAEFANRRYGGTGPLKCVYAPMVGSRGIKPCGGKVTRPEHIGQERRSLERFGFKLEKGCCAVHRAAEVHRHQTW